MSVVNNITGNVIKRNNNRSKRIASMLKKNNNNGIKPFVSRVEPTLTNRFFNLFSNRTPLPQGTFKKITKGGNMTNYTKRALGFLSERSRNVAKMNINKLTSKNTKKTLERALNKTKRNR